ncbi:sigma factor [Limnoglobus roseus]|uniref:Sigma-70 family RNA polymerase sigma factor n=1 Tax=Limnoglobus roseus TaxID=2598579 RepID=A0A5C1A827_9BACT|nr:sigma factor [Limnoglobus roseus]QEL14333.1 sigma-70 family RNA polymerase sigma factor [Limnoglobus roseus]
MCQAVDACPTTPSQAERLEMLQRAEPFIKSCVRKAMPRQADDLCQDARLKVWECTEKFDPARGVKWTTYVVGITKRIVLKALSTAKSSPVGEAWGGDQSGDDRTVEDLAEDIPKEDTDPFFEPEPDEELGDDVHRAVRAVAAEPLLACLSPLARSVVEPIILEGVNPAQVADRIDRSDKDTKLMIRNAVSSIAKRFDEANKAVGGKPRALGYCPIKREQFESLAIAALTEGGPDMRRIAKRFGVSVSAMSKWPAFRAAYDRMKPNARRTPAELEQQALALLAEIGPSLIRIATRLRRAETTLKKFPEFMAAYGQAKAQADRVWAERCRLALEAVGSGQSLVEIASAHDISPRTLAKLIAKRDAAKASGEREPAPAAKPQPAERPRSGHGWHFGKRLAPWTARTLGRRDRKR